MKTFSIVRSLAIFILVTVFALAITATPVFASSADLHLSADKAHLVKDQFVQVTIDISQNSNSVQGVDLHLKYDPMYLELVSPVGTKAVLMGNFFSGPHGSFAVRNTYDNSAGTAWFAAVNLGMLPENFPNTSTVGTVLFRVLEDVGGTTISLASQEPVVASSDGVKIPVDYNSITLLGLPWSPCLTATACN